MRDIKLTADIHVYEYSRHVVVRDGFSQTFGSYRRVETDSPRTYVYVDKNEAVATLKEEVS